MEEPKNPPVAHRLTASQRGTILNPVAWRTKAEELLAAAKRLEITFGADDLVNDVNSVYFMLFSFAVENLLKAALVDRNRAKYEESMSNYNAPTFPSDLKSHDVVSLAKERLGLRFSREQEDLLRRLSHCAVWSGRYPAPVKMEALSMLEDDPFTIGVFKPDDQESLHGLVDKLVADLWPGRDWRAAWGRS